MMHLIKINKEKNIISPLKITYYINPDYIYIPVKKNNLLVKQDEKIYKEMPVSQNKTYSSISGKAIGIKECLVLNEKSNTLVIANDFREYTSKNTLNKQELTIKSLLQTLEKNSEKKLLEKFKNSKTYEHIIIGAINDSPYVYNKIFLLKENIVDILEILENISLLYKCNDNYIVIKSDDAHLVDECLNSIGSYPKTKLTLVNDEYLLEKEDVVKEKLNLKRNTLYLDIMDILKIQNMLKGKTKSTMILTIAGNAIKENKVFRVKKYTLLSDIIEKYIDITVSNYIVIVNGLMEGFKIDNTDLVITEDIKSIHIMKKEKAKKEKCIKCGKCIEICPYKVNPLTLANKEKCIDCGLCSYICPCHINLRERLTK